MKARIRTAVLITSFLTGLAAYADPVLTVSDGVNSSGPITLPGGSGSYSNQIGSWGIVVAAGASKPFIGSASNPDMELDVSATTGGSANALTITLSDTNFGPTSGSNNLSALFNGIVAGGGSAVTFNTYYDTNDTLGAQTTLLTSSGAMFPPYS